MHLHTSWADLGWARVRNLRHHISGALMSPVQPEPLSDQGFFLQPCLVPHPLQPLATLPVCVSGRMREALRPRGPATQALAFAARIKISLSCSSFLCFSI